MMDTPGFMAKQKWRGDWKRAVQYVSETTGMGIHHAGCLIRRAYSAGYAWDTVDWDQLQGADLTYNDLVQKLEGQVGRTWTKTEFESEVQAIIEEYGE